MERKLLSQDDQIMQLGSIDDSQGLVVHISREEILPLVTIKEESDKRLAMEREQKEVISD
jgi:hypothetical protein